jgi:hypothetical protein
MLPYITVPARDPFFLYQYQAVPFFQVLFCKILNIISVLQKFIFFRLAFSKDTTVCTTAGATVRHLVSAVYDRAAALTEPPPVKVTPKTENSIVERVADP